MGCTITIGFCYGCGKTFAFSPTRVPSIVDAAGMRQPICRACVEYANPIRVQRGLAPIEILPGAYDADEEGDLDG